MQERAPSIESLDTLEERLRLQVEDTARVINSETGFIDIDWVNSKIDPYWLDISAQVAHRNFVSQIGDIDCVIPVPDRGKELAVGIARLISGSADGRVIYSPSKKLVVPQGRRVEEMYPKSWRDVVIVRDVVAVSSDVGATDMVLPFASGRALVVDDFCARGDTVLRVVKELLENDVEVAGVAIYVSKNFETTGQRGIMKIVHECGVPCFAVIELTGMTEEGGVTARTGVLYQ